jgi:hypothetical protein
MIYKYVNTTQLSQQYIIRRAPRTNEKNESVQHRNAFVNFLQYLSIETDSFPLAVSWKRNVIVSTIARVLASANAFDFLFFFRGFLGSLVDNSIHIL